MSTAIIQARPPSVFEFEAHQRINRKTSPHTRAAYRRDLKGWLAFCEFSAIDPRAATADHAARYRDHLRASISNESTRRALSALSWLYRVLFLDRLAAGNPFHPGLLVWPPAGKAAKTPLVTDDVAQAMIAHAKADESARGARDHAILRLLYDTGLRRESIATLTQRSYQPPQLVAIAKGDEELIIELPSETIDAISAWLEVAPSAPYLFAGRHGHINVSSINKLVRTRGSAVGHPEVHPHCFRAAWVTGLLDAGVPLYEIQAGAGHKDPKTTKRYDRGARGVTAAGKLAEFRRRSK